MKHRNDDIRARLSAGEVPPPPGDLLGRLRRDIPQGEVLRRRRSASISAGWRVAASVLMLVGLAYIAVTALESYQRREAASSLRPDSDYDAIAERRLQQPASATTVAIQPGAEAARAANDGEAGGSASLSRPAPKPSSAPAMAMPAPVEVPISRQKTAEYAPEPPAEDEWSAVETGVEGGVVGGVSGGIAGGSPGGVPAPARVAENAARDQAASAVAPPPPPMVAEPVAPQSAPAAGARRERADPAREEKAVTEPLRMGEGIVPPVILSRVDPYPTKEERSSGNVPSLYLAELVIDREGNVTSVRVIRPEGPQARAARESFMKWKFRPATKDGVPVPVYYNVTIHVRPQ